MPDVFERFRQGLLLHGAVCVTGVASEDELVVIALSGKHLGHVFIGDNPIVHVILHDIRIEIVAVADFHPDAYRFGRRVWDEVFMKFPGTVGSLRIPRPLLVDVGA